MQSNDIASPAALPDDILAAYCPILYLHHEDEYLPVSVEWFIARAQLDYYPNGVSGTGEISELCSVPGGVINLIQAGKVTQDELLAAQASCAQPENLSLTVCQEHYGGCRLDELSQVPVYVNAKLLVDDDGCPEAYEINYVTFYAFNGHYNLPANLPLFRAGQHVGDWEHLTVRLDAATLELQGVWYNAHRNIEGEWCPAARVPRTPCGRIIGYVAINGHGIYPHCGIIPRLFFVANDRTSRRGAVWAPARLVRLCGLDHGSSCCVVASRGCSLPPLRPPARTTNTTRTATSTHSCSGGGRNPGAQRPSSRVALAGDGADSGPPPPGDTAAGPAEPAESPVDSGSGLLQSSKRTGANLKVQQGAPDGHAAAVMGPPGPPATCGEAVVLTAGTAAAAAGPEAWSFAAAGGEEGRAEGLRAAGVWLEPRGSPGVGLEAAESALHPGGRGETFPLPDVVHDTSPWQRYRGRWGSVVSATQQGWFLGAEPPVSRGWFKRLFLPCAPGVERLARR